MSSPTIGGAPGPVVQASPAVPSVTTAMVVPVQIWLQGPFPSGTGDYARQVITAVLGQADEPVREVRVRLRTHQDPAVHFPVLAQVNLLMGGRLLRAQVHGATATQAVDLLQDRLRHQVCRRPECARTDWTSRQIPSKPWVACFPRLPQTRRIVRLKPVRPAVLGVDEAVDELLYRDYHFHLFIEAGTRQDSVVYHAGPTGFRLVQVFPAAERLASHTVPLTCCDRPAPRLDAAQAAEWLGWCEVPFLFFLDGDRGRGSVLYRRYDGHYGLIWIRT